jgi:outer membrane lipoprotein
MRSEIFEVTCGDRAARAAALLVVLTLGGCASQIPQAIRSAPAEPLAVTQVQQDPARFNGQQVRWGGTIIAVTNRPDSTAIEVLARPLGYDGRPRSASQGEGRFIARVAGFLDPAEYEKDRRLTVAGPVTGVETRPVGDFPYVYPVVRVEAHVLWPKVPPPGFYPYYAPGLAPWYGPWYGPGPWGRPGYFW